MWKKNKRYNSIFICALVVIVLALACFFGANKIEATSSANTNGQDTESSEIVDLNGKQKKYFITFSSAMKYALNDLDTSDGYTSTFNGTITGGLSNIYEFSQSIGGSKKVDNVSSQKLVQVQTLKHVSFGTNSSNLYYINKDKIYSKAGTYSSGSFVFPNEYATNDLDRFIEEWQIDPVSVPLRYSVTDCQNGKKVDTGNGYVLTFTADCMDLCSGVLAYCIKWINPGNAGKINPIPNDLMVKITLDAYGQLKTINSRVTYTCDLSGIGVPITVSGNFDVTETFKNIGKIPVVDGF